MTLQTKERLNVILTLDEQRKFVELGLLLNTIRVKAGLLHGLLYQSKRAIQQKEKRKKVSLSKKQALLFCTIFDAAA
jgi:hypothetical protein